MENTRYKILLIEDDKLDQLAFKRLLEEEQLPYDCTIAGSTAEAQRIIASERFDAIISDYSLGDGTAFDILSSVKDSPVIFVTGTGDEETAVKAWKAGAEDYLIKDLERNYLRAVPITVENVIRHKKTEEQLQLLSGAIMSTEDSVYIANIENKIIFVNKAFCETYGYSREDAIGKDSNFLWIGKPQGVDTRSVFRIVGSNWEVGFYHKRKDGSIFPVSLSRSIIKDSKGKSIAVVSVARDISERILIEDELRTLNQKLEKQNQLKSDLAIAVCHQLLSLTTQLKNTITGITSSTLGKIDAELHNNLEAADRDIAKFEGTINEFLDISQIDAGKLDLQKTQINLKPLVSEILRNISPLAAEKNIKLENLITDDEITIHADRERLTQILKCLVKNAIKTGRTNGQICINAKDAGKEIMVNVEDNGEGIESSEISRTFGRTTNIQKQLQYNTQDLTLALPLSKELVEMHGGSIWLENRQAGGKNIFFTLPKTELEEMTVSASAGEKNSSN